MRFANENGACEIDTLPGSPQIAVSHAVFIYPEKRGQGFGTFNHLLRLDRLANMGYNYVIATMRAGNAAEEAILTGNKWKKLEEFKSSATGNQVVIWGRHIERLTEARGLLHTAEEPGGQGYSDPEII